MTGAAEESAGARGGSEKSLARHTSIYAIAPLVQRVLALALTNAYTSKLSTGEWGILSQTDLFLALLPLLVGTSLLAGLTRHYFLHDVEADRRSVVTGTALALLAAASVGAGLAVVFRAPLAQLLFGGGGATVASTYLDLVVVAALVVPFSIATRLGIEYLQVQKRSTDVTKLEVSKALFEAGLKLWLIFGLEWGVLGFLLAVLAGEVVFGVGLLGWVLARLGPRFDWRTFRPVLAYALPLVPVGLFQLGLHQADKLLIEHLGPQDLLPPAGPGAPSVTLAKSLLGIYGLGYSIPLMFHSAVLYSFMRIWQPHVFGLRDGRARADELRRVGTLVALGFTVCYAQVAIFAREGVRLLGGQASYYAAEVVVPIVALAYLLYAFHALGQTVLLTARATKLLSVLCAGALAVNLGLNAALIPRFGAEAHLVAAVATLASFLVLAVSVATAARARLAAPFAGRTVALGVVCAAAAAAIARALDTSGLRFAAAFAAKCALSATFVLVVWRALVPGEARAALLARLPARLRRFGA